MKASTERIFTGRYANVMFADGLQRICTTMLGTLLPLYMVDLGYSKTVAGLTLTVYMLVAVVFRPIAGKLVDTKGRYLPLVIGTVAFLVGCGFFSADVPLPLFMSMRGLQGLGFSFIGTALMTMATDVIPKHRMSEGIGYLGLTNTISRALFPMVALWLKDAFGYQVTYLVIFGIAGLDLLVALALYRAGKREISAGDPGLAPDKEESVGGRLNGVKERFWEKLVDRDAVKPALIMLILLFASSSTMAFIVVYATAKGVANIGVFFTASAVSVAVARLSVGRLSQRFGSVAVLVPGMVLAAVSMLVLYWLDGLGILVVSGVLSGFGAGMVQPELNSLAVLLAREERRGSANSTFFMAMDLGCATGAVLLGLMADHTGLASIFLVGAALTGVALLVYLVFHARGLLRPASSPGRSLGVN